MNKKNSFSFILLVLALLLTANSYTQEKENQVTATYIGIDEMLKTFIFFSEERRKLSFFNVEDSVEIDLENEKNANKKYLVTWVMKTVHFYDSNGDLANSENARVITGLKEVP
ncbi:hypothetical protein [Tenacibaculum maritimum]|uniref:DUF3221 domain-containing protein n=1 Tax=Tenacibaculum maritimum NCIMB 2154 TaxID=1349785 RepID=A0A2H1EDQ0_9FLAO|nr:hypothetical protein [Tenacibaculum maritimum]MCD9562371.1 hypothetical protein [Tenacibaculum maritimum]MCD9565728.1 hypothetical protein [Tenacibaculum maritimum]MCD9579353.1 hypothetical protein [Tenacibaculum maritimum]MCD9580757.1 hypothetical protein [Tenacibaculum maritimum]MCD9585503.1 hypothetical protein [Tenacibaculum maritimum]